VVERGSGVKLSIKISLDEEKHQELQPLLSVTDLRKLFPFSSGFLLNRKRTFVHAVDGVSFELRKGETLSIVGESGSGKTTLAKLIVGLIEPTSGSIKFEGVETSTLKRASLQEIRKRIGMVFQDPFASLDSRMSVGRIIEEPMRVHGLAKEERKKRTSELLTRVGLKPEDAAKYPHQFSGGQRQRISTARALALYPDLIIADEPVSALDVSVQAKIINLFMQLQQELGLTFLFISHDLSIVRQISNRVIVMYLGKIVESSEIDALFQTPLHPYTKALLLSIPLPDPDEMKSRPPKALEGEIPSLISPPPGCRFHTRCPYATKRCSDEEPALVDAGGNHPVACHYWKEIQQGTHLPSLS
jgi:oligopeptide transport system ATP-binding protein